MNAIERKKVESARIRRKVWEFFTENPCHSKGECAEALGINPATVGKHAQAIKEGWRPEAAQNE